MGKRILVADDSLTIQKVIRLALSNEGYEIQTVSDGADAIQQISLFRPHAVLVDISLPTQNAFEIKRVINSQQDTQDVRFILMSSAFEKVDEAQATELRFEGRLTKPFDPAHLRQVIADVLKDIREDSGLNTEPPSISSKMPPLPKLEPAAPAGPSISIAELPSADDSIGLEPPFTPPSFPPSFKAPQKPVAPQPPLPPQQPQAPQPPLPPTFQAETEEVKSDDFPPLGEMPSFEPPQTFGAQSAFEPLQTFESQHSFEATPAQFPPPPPSLSLPKEDATQDYSDHSLLEAVEQTLSQEISTLPALEEETPHPEQDIKHLTESTIRMSGLDDFDWSINETAKKDSTLSGEQTEPALEPPANFADLGDSHFSFDDDDSTSTEEVPAFAETSSQKPAKTGQAPALSARDFSGQIEEAVRSEIQKTLERMAREILPEVAERIIKAEINKLLNEKT